MKKSFLTLIAFSVYFAVYCQDNKLKFGVRLGAGIAKQKASSYSGSSPNLVGYSIGVFAETPRLNEKVSIQPNILFSLKGGGANNLSSGPSYQEAKINYIELPINVLINMSDKLAVGLGPYLGYVIKSKIGGKQYEFNEYSSLKKLDYGYNTVIQVNITKGFSAAANYSSSVGSKGKTLNKILGLSILKSF